MRLTAGVRYTQHSGTRKNQPIARRSKQTRVGTSSMPVP